VRVKAQLHVDVAVVGGGPAGLAAAAALQVATSGSKQIHVFEKTSMKARGAAILVGVNGLKALHAISPSLLDSMVANATKLEGAGEAVPWLRTMQHVQLINCIRVSCQLPAHVPVPSAVQLQPCMPCHTVPCAPALPPCSCSWVLLISTIALKHTVPAIAGPRRPLQLPDWGTD
jgi:shikimate 5-dehydrogenase